MIRTEEESLEVEGAGDLDGAADRFRNGYAAEDDVDTASGVEDSGEEEEEAEEGGGSDSEDLDSMSPRCFQITRCWSEMTPCCAATACFRSWMAARNRGT